MLPKNRRIKKKEFTNILNNGKRYNSQNLLLYLLKTNKSEPSKFSFSISKKICKNAVDRNKYRRRGYSIVTLNMKNIQPGYLCFFSFKKGSNKPAFNALEKEITQLLHKASVIS